MPQGVHRLQNILVEEVSLVDRAANKRRFLLVKRDGQMSELQSNGRGGFTRVSKADDDDEEKRAAAAKAAKDQEDAEKAAKKPAFPGAAKPFGGGDKDKDKEKREKALKQIEALEAQGLDVTALKAAFNGPPEEDDDEKKKAKQAKADASGKALASELSSHVEAIEELIEQLGEHEDDEPSDVHMKKLDGMHKKLGSMCMKYGADKRASTSKAGRKMASRRLEMFQKALDTLQSLLSELMETPASANEHKADPGDPQAPPKGWSPANPSGVPTGTAGTAGGVTKADLEALTKSLEEKFSAERSELKSKISRLEKMAPAGNARPQEQVTKSTVEEKKSWPMDMNDDRFDREKVDKSVSFFDD